MGWGNPHIKTLALSTAINCVIDLWKIIEEAILLGSLALRAQMIVVLFKQTYQVYFFS